MAGDEAPLLLVSGVLQGRGKMCGYIVGLQSLIDFTKIIGLRKLTIIHILRKPVVRLLYFLQVRGL